MPDWSPRISINSYILKQCGTAKQSLSFTVPRKLLCDGAPGSEVLYGINVEPYFFDPGYEVFRDQRFFRATFTAADLAEPALPPGLRALQGKMDVISAMSLSHLFPLESQRNPSKNQLALATAVSGTMIFGRWIYTRPGEVKGPRNGEKTFPQFIMSHGAESWEAFWQELAAESGAE